jgi:hypothetical protein
MKSRSHLETVTEADRLTVGNPDPGTLIYRREGSEEEGAKWFEYVQFCFGPAVSPGGVSLYVPVSRAAVHKRLQAGLMTAFLFHTTHREGTFWGKERTVKTQPYVYIPVSECKVWAAEIVARPENFNAFLKSLRSQDFDDDFLQNDPSDIGRRDIRRESEFSIPQLVKLLFK